MKKYLVKCWMICFSVRNDCLQQVLFYLREKEGLSERMLDMLLTSILSNVDEILHKWEVYKDKAN